MSFAVAFNVISSKSYPTRKRVHLLGNIGGDISTVERSYLNQAIYDLYGRVNSKIDKTHYGMVNIERKPTSPYVAILTEDRRVADLFTPEHNEL